MKPKPDFEVLRQALLREGEPERVPFFELFADREIMEAVTHEPMGRYASEGTREGWVKYWRAQVKFYHSLGYDYVQCPSPLRFQRTNILRASDTAQRPRAEREWVDEHHGMIEDWEDFEEYEWPDVERADFSVLDFLAKNLPDGMKMIFLGPGGVLENLMWLTGYEVLSYMLYDDPDLVKAISDRVGSTIVKVLDAAASRPEVGAIVLGDDMGFKTAPMVGPEALRKYVFPWQRKSGEVVHSYSLPFILHSCGNLEEVMDDLIDHVGIDAKHSFEDAIMPVAEAKRKYGHRIAILGGVDVDFLARHPEDEVRKCVRRILEECAPGGGYALGSGNSVANYVPVENYLAMLDEGRKFNRGAL